MRERLITFIRRSDNGHMIAVPEAGLPGYIQIANEIAEIPDTADRIRVSVNCGLAGNRQQPNLKRRRMKRRQCKEYISRR